MLIEEALQVSYEKRPRIYYLAETKCGIKVIRGSCRDMYSYAVVRVPTNGQLDYPNQLTWGSFHKTEQLANRTKRSWEKYKEKSNYYGENDSWEVVTITKITAKEVRQLKKLDRLAYKEFMDKHKEQLEQELENLTETKN